MFSKFNIALIIYCCLVFKSVVVGSQPNITQLQCDCGRANERGPKIVGGAEVHPYKYPWMNRLTLVDQAFKAFQYQTIFDLFFFSNVEYERPGRHAIAAGWGETKSAQTDGSQGSLVNQYLKEIESRIVNTNDSIITAVGVNGRGVCYGDSGSPLFTRYADGKFHVIGVISRGPSNCSGPFLSPRISPINQWIRRNVMDSEPCEKAIYQIKPNDTSYM
ncbi:CLIP domain-containing serine protease 14D [Argiope bruennichi]|uniref:CLIP domain-containing serine protease 14D n=1 Tax=Argiope bruennichi TaxID=94029 RepID=A0A8T0ESU3_ARGBR|nr:CLIP domain-containing serine protease 14D [Argiope bruennichi]